MPDSETVYRPGYAPDNAAAVGYRGLRTRQRILDCAERLFVANGYYGTSIDAIAREVGGSRAGIYQYFGDKRDIFRELFGQCRPVVLDHGRRLGGLGPDAEGLHNLHRWLVEWADMPDTYAMVLLELPGIGTIDAVPEIDDGAVSAAYTATISAALRDAGVRGLDPDDAATALIGITQMVNLYRLRGNFGLSSSERTSASLTIAMQRLLFPETPTDVLQTVAMESIPDAPVHMAAAIEPAVAEDHDPQAAAPVRQALLSAAAALFAERGYYPVSMPDIAAAATTSRATLYRYFGNKAKILAVLSERGAAEAIVLANELRVRAETGIEVTALRDWLTRQVAFQRAYNGVADTWHDGTLVQQLGSDAVAAGVAAFHAATTTLVNHTPLPIGVHPTVAAVIVQAVFLTLPGMPRTHPPEHSDADTAALELTVLQRALFGETPTRRESSGGSFGRHR